MASSSYFGETTGSTGLAAVAYFLMGLGSATSASTVLEADSTSFLAYSTLTGDSTFFSVFSSVFYSTFDSTLDSTLDSTYFS